MGTPAIDIQAVTKKFRLHHERANSVKERVLKFGRNSTYEDLLAVDDVSFSIAEGEAVGILGHNGSGKSTLLKCICGVLRPSSGQIQVKGKLAALLELGAGFQPELSGRDNIYLNGAMMGLSKREIDRVFDAIVDFSELEQFIDNQVKFYSSGMYVRLGFAVAVNVDPDILVVDEVLAVGDERFQKKCIDRIRQFKQEGRTIVVVSHSADQVKLICDHAVVLSHGKMISNGTPATAVQALRASLLEEGLLRESPELAEQERIVRVDAIRVGALGEGVGATDILKSGDPLSLDVVVEAEREIQDLVVAIEIHDPSGALLLKTTTANLGYAIDVPAATSTISLDLPVWPLGDTPLQVSVGLQDRNGGQDYDWKENAGEIQTVSQRRSFGLLSVPVEVRVSDRVTLRRAKPN